LTSWVGVSYLANSWEQFTRHMFCGKLFVKLTDTGWGPYKTHIKGCEHQIAVLRIQLLSFRQGSPNQKKGDLVNQF
jgi:hypothetical protein